MPGGVTAAKGFKAGGLYGGLRAKGDKPDLALVACDVDATAAGKNITSILFLLIFGRDAEILSLYLYLFFLN